jgi:type III restriction enzyme
MNRHVNAIAARLSLRPPQRRSLEILDRVTEIVPPGRGMDPAAALAVIASEFPSVTDFERAFPSICFALATGVGKTRLMGAFIAYLHLAHGMRTFFVLAPNLTIYEKLIADFTQGTPKYVFKGISEFAVTPPEIITGDNWENRGAQLDFFGGVTVNIFNISKLNTEARGGRKLKLRSFRETLGESYFDHLAAKHDLVLIMDESHRYRGTAGWTALNELNPVLGLEVTATPFEERGARGPVPFENVIYDYPLGKAMEDGFVKEPAVVTRKDFDPADFSATALERLKLEDGLALHEQVKVQLATYATEAGRPRVKPFMLVIARDTTHAGELKALVETVHDGRYAGRVIQVDSSAKDEEVTRRLLEVEMPEEPTEVVIHVNMLKEGWDVTNLYTIVPLRAANARTLVEQSIGRGLRLPYGQRTGVEAVDTLSIVAHDRFQEIVDEARRPDSPIRMKSVVLDGETIQRKLVTVVANPGYVPREPVAPGVEEPGPSIWTEPERKVAEIAIEELHRLSARPGLAPTSEALTRPEVQAEVLAAVRSRVAAQPSLPGLETEPDVEAIVRRAAEGIAKGTIDIPRIVVMPKGRIVAGFQPFTLELTGVRPARASDTLWIQNLRSGGGREVLLKLEGATGEEKRPEDYIVRHLIDFHDIDYGAHAELLYDLAGQAVAHLRSYLPTDEVEPVLRQQGEALAALIHVQMQGHYSEGADEGYQATVHRGWTELRPCAYTAVEGEGPRDFRQAPANLSGIGRYVFGGFSRCLYPVQKFHSNPERLLAVILEREAIRWFRPVSGQFQIRYRRGADHPEYIPDFVAETADRVLMLEVKARNETTDPEVRSKAEAAMEWCRHASDYAASQRGKPWSYAILPHDVIKENMSLAGLLAGAALRGDLGSAALVAH